MKIVRRFGIIDVHFYRNGVRLWFAEFLYKFWNQCYLLLACFLIEKMKRVYINEFNCIPARNGCVYAFHNFSPLCLAAQ